MNIEVRKEQNKITLCLDGWLDTLSSPQLGEEVEKIKDTTALILDFEKVEYIASSGLRQVVAAYNKAKEQKADFSVINVGTETMNIFKLTGLDKKIKIIEK